MRLILSIFLILILCFDSISQTKNSNKLFRPCFDSSNKTLSLRNEKASWFRKVTRASAFVFGFEAIGVGILAAMPSHFSNWNIKNTNVALNYTMAWTKPPVVDKDIWYINYLGHPYQGVYKFNALRSQGATFTHSAMFCIGHVLIWEYLLEASMERPSIQDLVVTPVAGVLLGELVHFGTLKMIQNKFKWYEKAIVTIINPMFILNNRYNFEKRICKQF